MNTTWETHKFEHYIFSLLLAVEVIMSFTFLGYVHIPPISITTAYIPIIITACLFGPAEASLAGLLFGLGSLYKPYLICRNTHCHQLVFDVLIDVPLIRLVRA